MFSKLDTPLYKLKNFIEFAYFPLAKMNTIELRYEVDFDLPISNFHFSPLNSNHIKCKCSCYYSIFTLYTNYALKPVHKKEMILYLVYQRLFSNTLSFYCYT